LSTFLYAGRQGEGKNAWDEGVIIASGRWCAFHNHGGCPVQGPPGRGLFEGLAQR